MEARGRRVLPEAGGCRLVLYVRSRRIVLYFFLKPHDMYFRTRVASTNVGGPSLKLPALATSETGAYSYQRPASDVSCCVAEREDMRCSARTRFRRTAAAVASHPIISSLIIIPTSSPGGEDEGGRSTNAYDVGVVSEQAVPPFHCCVWTGEELPAATSRGLAFHLSPAA